MPIQRWHAAVRTRKSYGLPRHLVQWAGYSHDTLYEGMVPLKGGSTSGFPQSLSQKTLAQWSATTHLRHHGLVDPIICYFEMLASGLQDREIAARAHLGPPEPIWGSSCPGLSRPPATRGRAAPPQDGPATCITRPLRPALVEAHRRQGGDGPDKSPERGEGKTAAAGGSDEAEGGLGRGSAAGVWAPRRPRWARRRTIGNNELAASAC